MTKAQLEQRFGEIKADLDELSKKIQSLDSAPADCQCLARLARRRAWSVGRGWRRFSWVAGIVAGIALISGLVVAQTREALFIDERGNVGIGKADKLEGLQVVLPEGKQSAPGAGITISGGREGNARIELRNDGSGTPYIDFAVKGLEADYDGRLRLVAPGKLAVEGTDLGVGTTTPRARLDVQQGDRTLVHPNSVKGLYVTGDFAPDNGVEFRHSNGTQGIGFGYNTIYATGGNASQDLNLKARGAGKVNVQGPLVVNSLQIGNTIVGERELQILRKLAQGDLQVDIFNVKQGEYLYAGDYAPFDNDRRRVFTWRPKNRVNQGQWLLRFPQ